MIISSFFNRTRAGLRWFPALCCAIIIFTLSATPGEGIGQSYDRLDRLKIKAIKTRTGIQANKDWREFIEEG